MKNENSFFDLLRATVDGNHLASMKLIELRVWTILMRHRNSKTGLAFPGLRMIADRAGTNKSAVARALRGLAAKGFVSTDEKGGGRGHATRREITVPESVVKRTTLSSKIKGGEFHKKRVVNLPLKGGKSHKKRVVDLTTGTSINRKKKIKSRFTDSDFSLSGESEHEHRRVSKGNHLTKRSASNGHSILTRREIDRAAGRNGRRHNANGHALIADAEDEPVSWLRELGVDPVVVASAIAKTNPGWPGRLVRYLKKREDDPSVTSLVRMAAFLCRNPHKFGPRQSREQEDLAADRNVLSDLADDDTDEDDETSGNADDSDGSYDEHGDVTY